MVRAAKASTQKMVVYGGMPFRPRAPPSASTFWKMTRMISPKPRVTSAR